MTDLPTEADWPDLPLQVDRSIGVWIDRSIQADLSTQADIFTPKRFGRPCTAKEFIAQERAKNIANGSP